MRIQHLEKALVCEEPHLRRAFISDARHLEHITHTHARMHTPHLQPAGTLVAKCKSLDQGRSVVTFLDAASEKALRSTVALTASRGRGKVGVRVGVHVWGCMWGGCARGGTCLMLALSAWLRGACDVASTHTCQW